MAGNIRVIEVYNHKIVIRFKDKDIVLNDKLSRIEKEVLPFSFVKISRSCLINLKYVEKMDKNHCIMSNGDSLHIAEDRIKTVNERWLQYAMRH